MKFNVLLTVNITFTVVQDVTPYDLVDWYQRFGGACSLRQVGSVR
jgi:hypothetical protein